jgi:hypothetical protein
VNKRIVLPAVILTTLLAVGVWFYQSPYLTLMDIKIAAKAGDVETLEEKIDFPKLRASVQQALANSAGVDEQSTGMSGFLTRMVIRVVSGPVIDRMLTPESISLMFSGVSPGRNKPTVESSSDDSGKIIYDGDWTSFSTYTLLIEKPGVGQKLSLIMERKWLTWRLVGVSLGITRGSSSHAMH